MRVTLLTACATLLGAACIPAAAEDFAEDNLWRFQPITEAGETLPAADFGFEGTRAFLQVGCDRLTHNLTIRYADGPIPDRLGDLELIIEGASIHYAMRAERVEGGVYAWARPTPALLAALQQDGALQLRLPYQREPLGIGRAEPLRRVAELCRARNIVPPEDFAAGRILDAKIQVLVTVPGSSMRFPGRLEISATVARYEGLAGAMQLEYAGRMPAAQFGSGRQAAEIYRVVNAAEFGALNAEQHLCREPLRWVTITGGRNAMRVGWLAIEDWHDYRSDGPGFCSEQPYQVQER